MPRYDEYIDPSGQRIQVTMSSLNVWTWQLTIQRGDELPITSTIDTAGSANSLTAYALAHLRVGDQMKRWAAADATTHTEYLEHLIHYAKQLMKLPQGTT